jgi:gliding motility-associated-like protein
VISNDTVNFVKCRPFLGYVLALLLSYVGFQLNAQELSKLCGGSKGIRYHVTGNSGSIFHWTVEGGQIISDPQANSIAVNWNNQPGIFNISVFEETSTGCLGNSVEAKVEIIASPLFELGPPKTICEGTQVELSPGSGFSKYLWQDGSINPVFIVSKAGMYWVEVTNLEGCSYRDSLNVSISSPQKIDLGKDTMICSPNELVLDAGNNATFYEWSNGLNTQSIIAHEGDGQIWVKVVDAFGCKGSDTIQILNCVLQNKLEIANAFTPNGDNHNDFWEIRGCQYYPNMTVKIFDRWGIQVFSSAMGYSYPWDGTSNGKQMPTSAYYYVINLGDGSKEITGSITLIR